MILSSGGRVGSEKMVHLCVSAGISLSLRDSGLVKVYTQTRFFHDLGRGQGKSSCLGTLAG